MAGQRHFIPLRDIALAIALLTRLPVAVDAEYASARGAKAAWAYPVAGLAAALPAAIVGWSALAAGLPSAIAAGIALALLVIVTGAMHEDGLADTADGLWGGWTRERRLEIMKDSHIGTYGVLALVLSVGLRWSALAAVGPGLVLVVLATAILSRAPIPCVMAGLPNARDGGLSKSVGRPAGSTAGLALLVAVLLAGILLGPVALALGAACLGAALACALVARRKIGGQTGDILGATQQICEIACLLTAILLLD